MISKKMGNAVLLDEENESCIPSGMHLWQQKRGGGRGERMRKERLVSDQGS